MPEMYTRHEFTNVRHSICQNLKPLKELYPPYLRVGEFIETKSGTIGIASLENGDIDPLKN